MDLLYFFIPLLLSTLYVLLCPFTKVGFVRVVAVYETMLTLCAQVEESFHLQATHDVLFHGRDIAAYDHLAFPGVVPRTFLGSIVLATAAAPGAAAIRALGLPKLAVQLLVRVLLATGTCFALWRVHRATEFRFGRNVAIASSVLLCVTPHTLFYASRTLPNTFALLLVAHAIAEWLLADSQVRHIGAPRVITSRSASSSLLKLWSWLWGDDVAPFGFGNGRRFFPPAHASRALLYLASAALWFRCDMVILAGTIVLSMLFNRKITLPQGLLLCCVVAPVLLFITVLVDSAFWGRWLWPEGEVLFFNAVANRSSEYGVSPWHWYATSALPRLLLGGLFFLPAGLVRLRSKSTLKSLRKKSWCAQESWSMFLFFELIEPNWDVLQYGVPAFSFVALYSFLPHKETRFLLPVMPLLFILCGGGLANVFGVALTFRQGSDRVRGDSVTTALLSHNLTSVRRRPRARRSRAQSGMSATLTAKQVISGSSEFFFVLILSIFLCVLLASILVTAVFIRASRDNYPGGVALQRVYTLLSRESAQDSVGGSALVPWWKSGAELPSCLEGDVAATSPTAEWARTCLVDSCMVASPRPPGSSCVSFSFSSELPRPPRRAIRIHIDVAAAESGVSRFGEAWGVPNSWVYSKAENLTFPEHFNEFDLLLTETPLRHTAGGRYCVIGAAKQHVGFEIDWLRFIIVFNFTQKVYILGRVCVLSV